ncbi:hypothetical protein, partial [Bacteroides pyogenes]|uniref:hypothetical protein n=1 Tax=Bacteroides pyogenes TaxID=310300 RepID=UPI001E4D94B0
RAISRRMRYTPRHILPVLAAHFPRYGERPASAFNTSRPYRRFFESHAPFGEHGFSPEGKR